MTPTNLHLRAGDTLDHFQLEEVVATSGMATVFRAIDRASGQQVAIKVPHPEIESDPLLYDRFEREEEIGTRMHHPGVMKVIPNPDRSQVYMVMEWVPGRLLRSVLNEKKKLPIARAVALTVRILAALEYIHGHGVAHRDLKPENIMVDESVADWDLIRLIDFGIAQDAGSRRLTFANFSQSMGTPDYISPEQVRGKRGDARSDLYALGVMLYEMLTGRVPFTGPNPFVIMNDRLLNPPVPPRRLEPAISLQLQEILYRALEREPKNRYQTAREFAYDLENQAEVGVGERVEESRWAERRSPAARRVAIYFGLAMLPVVILLLLFFVARHR